MVERPNSIRVKRGFHRIGIALALFLGACAAALGVILSVQDRNEQEKYFQALRCAAAKLNDDEVKQLQRLVPLVPSDPSKRRLPKEAWPVEMPIGLLGCGEFETERMQAYVEEIDAARRSDFSDIRDRWGYHTLARSLGVTALVTGCVAFATYFLVAIFSWIVRGFMHD